MRTTAKHGFAAYSLEDSLQKENSRSLTCYIFKSYLFFLTRYGRFRLRFFLFVRVCAAEPRPDFRYRSNANDGKARLCRVLTRGLAPKRKQQVCRPAVFFLERETRFELATFALARQRSTTEPFPHSGGNNRARTYDPLLVRQMLSQLSYAPVTLNAYIL